jgi:glycopeptide antibiotics resistance protein
MLRELYYQILVYRSLVTPFLIASSIVVPFWLAFRLFRLRTRGQRTSPGRESLLLVFVVYLACLAAATLAPNYNPRLRIEDTTRAEFRPDIATLTCASASLPAGSRARHFCMYNAKGNILLFLPLGFLLPLVWRRLGFWKGLQIALGLSVSIEVLQLVSRAWGSYRATDVNDVILNVAGACIGLAIALLIRSLGGFGRAPASQPT